MADREMTEREMLVEALRYLAAVLKLLQPKSADADPPRVQSDTAYVDIAPGVLPAFDAGWHAEGGMNSSALHHFYFTDEDETNRVSELHFQDGSVQKHGVNGVTNEQVITALVTRIRSLNALVPCRENSLAITKLEESLHWLNARTADRQQRGVEGSDRP